MRTILALLAFAGFANAEVKIVGELKYKPYQLVRLRAEGADPKAALLWRIHPESVDRATCPKGSIEFCATPGRYRVELIAISVGADGALSVEEDRKELTIGEPSKPIPPMPVDPVARELQALYDADAGPMKADSLASLVAIFGASSDAASNNTNLKNCAQLAEAVRAISKDMLPANALPELRKRVGKLLHDSLPADPDTPLTAETRKRASEAYLRVKSLLEQIKE